jgi:hypothetical protein
MYMSHSHCCYEKVCEIACGQNIGKVISSRENFLKYVPIIGSFYLPPKSRKELLSAPTNVPADPRMLSPEVLTVVEDIFQQYLTLYLEWDRLSSQQQARYDRNEKTALESDVTTIIAPTTVLLLAVVLPVKVACLQDVGMPIPLDVMVSMSHLVSSYLSRHLMDDDKQSVAAAAAVATKFIKPEGTVYIPSEGDIRLVIEETVKARQRKNMDERL